MSKKITKTTTLEKILGLPAQAGKKSGAEILAKHNVPCLSCPMASFEVSKLKIGEVCEMYGIDEKELLKDLNK